MTEKHIHKLKRLKYKSGNIVFFCALPDCSFKTNIALALGKRSICWRCGKDFIMSEYDLRLAKPHCEACHKTKKVEASLDEIIQDVHIAVSPEAINKVLAEQPLSLSERLQQAINFKQQPQQQEDEEI